MAELHSYKVIERQVGLLGGTVLLVGTVIGISVFLLPGALIGQAGPSIVLALGITAIPMVFALLMLLQLGGAMPVAGGVYVYASRLIGPLWGFLVIWIVVPAIWAVLLFTAIGFAEFAGFFVDIPFWMLMTGVLMLFLVLNLLGITIVASVQLAMVVAIMLGMLSFILPATGQIEAANYSPMFPEGIQPFITAVVALYIPFQGFSMIIELGEELKDPIRNIPRVLFIGMVAVVLLSFGLVFTFVGLDNYQVLSDLGPRGLAEAADAYLPAGIGPIVAIAAVLGALTTLNAIITSYSRTLMRAGRDEVVNHHMADIHPRTKVPHWAILVLGVPPVLASPFAWDAVSLAIFLALVITFGGFLLAIALWRLPNRFPDQYQHSIYRLPIGVLKVAAVGSATSSVLFWLAMGSERPLIIGIIVALLLVGYGAYRSRLWWHARHGIDMRVKMSLLDEHERVAQG